MSRALTGWPAAVLMLWVIMALAGLSDGFMPYRIDLQAIFQPPGMSEWLGTDELGRSVLDRLFSGAGVSLLVALVSVVVSATIGIAIGLVAGYFGGWVDRIISRVIEIFLAFPGMLLAIAMAAMIGPGVENVIIALSVMGWVGYARLVRVQTLAMRHREHVQAALSLGQSHVTVMRRHVLPLVMAPEFVIENCGPVHNMKLVLRHGINVMTAPNGSGKSILLEAAKSLAGGSGRPPLSRGEERGRVAGMGARITISNKSVRHTGEFQVEHLEGRFDLGAIVDPGVSDPLKADRRRIRALLAVMGVKGGPDILGESGLFDMKELEEIVGYDVVNMDDLVDQSKEIVKGLQAEPRHWERAAEK